MPRPSRRVLLKACDTARDEVAEACKKFAEANDSRVADYDFVMTPNEQLAYSYLKSQLRILDAALDELHYAPEDHEDTG